MRLHVIDGTYELYRAHFSPRPDKTAILEGRGGAPVTVKATVGVMASLLALLADPDERPTHLAVAFDNPITSFRNALFDGYKSDEGVPPELRQQFDLVEEAVRSLGIVVWSMDHYEADDALATAAARWGAEVEQVRIMTPDKDLGQAVRGTRVVQVDRMRRKVIDEEAVRTVRGVGPASIPDYLALVGDTSDGIPGIDGFGPKSAAAVLARYAHLEDIPDAAAAWDVRVTGAPRLAKNLADHRAEAMLYRRLATLAFDVPLTESLDDLAFRGVPRDAFEAVTKRLGAGDLAARVDRWR